MSKQPTSLPMFLPTTPHHLLPMLPYTPYTTLLPYLLLPPACAFAAIALPHHLCLVSVIVPMPTMPVALASACLVYCSKLLAL